MPGFDLREIENVGDDAGQRLRAVFDAAEVFAQARMSDVGLLGEAHQTEQSVQRRADLMAGVGEEFALGAARRFGTLFGFGERLVRLAPLRHVVEYPDVDRAVFVRHRARPNAEPSQHAVMPLELALEVDRLAQLQRRLELEVEARKTRVVGPAHRQRLAAERPLRPAQLCFDAWIGMHDGAFTREQHADHRALQRGLEIQD